ncbi:uncharacterized protein [Periplaneta americana]|uniref:uncharacterized protein isoform X4 n=1 Tax=Periplaneta americana TaxID=6978 RepID=UPI0037E807D3
MKAVCVKGCEIVYLCFNQTALNIYMEDTNDEKPPLRPTTIERPSFPEVRTPSHLDLFTQPGPSRRTFDLTSTLASRFLPPFLTAIPGLPIQQYLAHEKRPLICGECGKEFGDLNTLKNHLLNHTGGEKRKRGTVTNG